jgi:hypothetical protein
VSVKVVIVWFVTPCSLVDRYKFLEEYAASIVRVEDEAIPLQALTGRKGSRRLRLPDFKTIGT